MRNLKELDTYRVINEGLKKLYGDIILGPNNGAFVIPYGGSLLRILASNGGGWDHISVSLEDRIPNWYEMEHVKRLFFKDNEIAVQYHLPSKDHINIHPNVLHLWRPHKLVMPLPPKDYV
jgi:hypothetical protein